MRVINRSYCPVTHSKPLYRFIQRPDGALKPGTRANPIVDKGGPVVFTVFEREET